MEDTRSGLPDPLYTFSVKQAVASLDSGWQRFPGHYLLYAATGAFHLDIEGMRWYLPPQRAAWVAAGTKIRIWSDKPVTSRSVLFAGNVRDPGLPPCRVFAPNALVRELLSHVMRWPLGRDLNDKNADSFFDSLSALSNELAAQPERFWLPRSDDPALDALAQYIRDHLDRPLNAADLAKAAHMSERTLARRFRELLQMTAGQYVHRARMLRSLELLESRELSVSQVAWAVGFESLSAFVSAFKTFTQETPTQYRRRIWGSKPEPSEPVLL